MRRSMDRSRLAHTVLCVLGVVSAGLLLTGCDSSQPATSAADRSAGTIAPRAAVAALRGDAATLATEIGRPSADLAQQYRLIDPRKDEGWETETLTELAYVQLKRIGKWVEDTQTATPAAAAEVADPQFESPPLRPEKLADVYTQGDLLRVRRPEPGSKGSSRVAYRGPNGLLAAIQHLCQPIAALPHRDAHFKIFQIHIDGQIGHTTAYFDAGGRSEDRAIQQNAIWRCRWRLDDGQAPKLLSVQADAYEECTHRGKDGRLFVDATQAVLGGNRSYHEALVPSVDHWRTRIERRFDVNWTGFHGLAVGDVNGDGLEDLLVCQPGGLPNRLYQRRPDGTLVDVSAEAGIDWLEYTRAALFVDLDNDGDQDLVLAMPWGLVFHENDGRGRFTLRGNGLLSSEPYSLTAADYDGDGQVDLYVCCYSSGWAIRQDDRFPSPLPLHDANNGDPNTLLRNEGNWRFLDVTRRVGLDANNRRFSLAAVWEDFDNDGDPDLYVANDFGRNNLYRNDGGRFVDVAPEAGVEDIGPGMSCHFGDFDLDGHMDLYVANMFSSAGNRVAFQQHFHRDADAQTLAQLQRHARGNSLFRNLGNGQFEDVSLEAMVNMGRWAWSSLFFDLNNDGWEDLYVVNGYVTQTEPGDL